MAWVRGSSRPCRRSHRLPRPWSGGDTHNGTGYAACAIAPVATAISPNDSIVPNAAPIITKDGMSRKLAGASVALAAQEAECLLGPAPDLENVHPVLARHQRQRAVEIVKAGCGSISAETPRRR